MNKKSTDMEDKAQVIKHLEMIQGVVNRLGHDSFLIKSWSMTILVFEIIFIARNEIALELIILTLLIPVIGFWVLDSYFLWHERLFREVYDEVRKQETTDFAMNPREHTHKPNCSWLASMFSCTLKLFYGIEAVFVIVVFFIINYLGGNPQ